MRQLANLLLVTAWGCCLLPGQRPAPLPYPLPDIAVLTAPSHDDLAEPVERYSADLRTLQRFFENSFTPSMERAMRQFYQTWQSALERIDFAKLGPQARIDYLLFRNTLRHELRQLDQFHQRAEELKSVLPFAVTLVDLKEARQRLEPVDPQKAAATLTAVAEEMDKTAKRLAQSAAGKEPPIAKTLAYRAAGTAERLRLSLKQWHDFYNGYDPLFTWWVAEPYKRVDDGLKNYAAMLREKVAGARDRDTIIGDPIGRDALLAELAYEMIPYTPEQLIELANREFAWCENEMRKASAEMGFGDDWRKALEKVKNDYMPPGEQPALILKQAVEAIQFLDDHDLVTIPPLARDTWRMQMMTPERQRINPFFTGGEVISVSYPTMTMSHEQKLMSMRGNNIHYSRATVFHELIPGHYLQMFMNQRYRPYRAAFSSPFAREGWSLYWEMLLWDLNFPQSPENRIGMLFWRGFRAARILFSLNFHLGKMTAQECVDFLVNRVGHERENAEAEVRRSFETDYEPLYQSAYLLGGLQIRALHKELVDSGKMTNRQFHDAILKLNSIPIEMVRASLLGQTLERNFVAGWKFYGDL